MARARLAFLFGWGLFMLFAQIPVLLIGSAVGYESYTMGILEAIAAIVTVMFTTIVLVGEGIDGEEIIHKKRKQK
jgi:hypothetical protein